MEQISQAHIQQSYCLNHKTRKIEYACMDLDQSQKLVCSICQLKGKSSQSVNNFILIQEVQENDQQLPIQNWPQGISHDLMDHLYMDRSQIRVKMEQKISSYFKQLECTTHESIQKKYLQTLNILNALYDELDLQQSNYNKFFLREKLFETFKNGISSNSTNEQFSQLVIEIEDNKRQNLDYLEKRRILAEDFEKKQFQQPLEIKNTINMLLQSIDFFENEEIQSIIPNYKSILKNENTQQDLDSLISQQTIYFINQSCKLQQIISEQSQIVNYRKEMSFQQFEKLTDSYIFQDLEDIINKLKVNYPNVFEPIESQTKNNLIQSLEKEIQSYSIKYTDQEINNHLKSMSSKQFVEVVQNIQKIYKQTLQGSKLYSSQLLEENIRIRPLQPIFDSLKKIINTNQRFQFNIIPSNYRTRPAIESYKVSAVNEGQVYLDCELNPKKSYILILNIDTFQSCRSLRLGLLNTQYTDRCIKSDNFKYYSNQQNICIDTQDHNNSILMRGNFFAAGTIPKYLEMRVSLEKKSIFISDYPYYNNIVKSAQNIDTMNNYRLAFGFGSNPQEQIVTVEYLQETDEFEDF
ncbi:hypothetical protein ABPG74_009193 [Tetrahymena malaccensis]